MLEVAIGLGVWAVVASALAISWWREARNNERETRAIDGLRLVADGRRLAMSEKYEKALRKLNKARHEAAIQLGEAKYWMARAEGAQEKAQQAVNFLDYQRAQREPAKTIEMDGFESKVDEDVRSLEAAISEDSIQRGIEALRTEYSDGGLPLPPEADLRSEVELLFNASQNAEGQIE